MVLPSLASKKPAEIPLSLYCAFANCTDKDNAANNAIRLILIFCFIFVVYFLILRNLNVVFLYKGCKSFKDNLHIENEVVCLSVGDVELLSLVGR